MHKIKIGIEVHSRITAAKQKLFSLAPNPVSEIYEPNSCVDLNDLGLPGALPVLNADVVKYAVRTCLALNMNINEEFSVDRKLYYCEDLPSGYQLTQFFKPIGIKGILKSDLFTVGIRQLHIETDASKVIAYQEGILLDHNRSGAPLMEIVTEPDFTNADQVVAFSRMLRSILKYIGTSDCKMEIGHYRTDVSISIDDGNRVEVKNLNSDDAVRKAISYELDRQSMLLRSGNPTGNETRSFDGKKTLFLRKKETADEYMYFPEPDFSLFGGIFKVDESMIIEQHENTRRTPAHIYNNWKNELALTHEQLENLISEPHIIRFVESAFEDADINIKKIIVNIVCKFIFAKLQEDDAIQIKPSELNKLAKYIANNKLNAVVVQQIIDIMWNEDEDPLSIIDRLNLAPIRDVTKIRSIVSQILDEYPEEKIKYNAGKKNVIGFFIGKAMKKTNNKASGDILNQVLIEELNRE